MKKDSHTTKTRTSRTQAERSASMRRRLIDAATTHLATVGFASFSVESIAELAGVSRGAVHHHFGNRNGLLKALIENLGQMLLASPSAKVDGTIKDRLYAALDSDWSILSQERFVAALQILLAMRDDEELLQQIVAQITSFEDELDANWAELVASADADHARIMTLRHIASAAMRGLIIRNVYRDEKVDVSAEIAMLQRMCLRELQG